MYALLLDQLLQLLATIANDLDAMLLDLCDEEKQGITENKTEVQQTETYPTKTKLQVTKSQEYESKIQTTTYISSLTFSTTAIMCTHSNSEEKMGVHGLISEVSSDSDHNSVKSSDLDFFSAEDRSSGTGTYFASSEGEEGPMSLGSSLMVAPKTSLYETPFETPSSTPYSTLYNKVQITLMDRLAHTHPIWYLPTVARSAAIHLLQAMPEGTFLIRQSSRPDTLALSVRTDPRPTVQHYLIQNSAKGLHLESSGHFFPAIHTLVAHYCNPQEELPVKLVLPEAILAAKSYTQLSALSYLGQDFWRYSSEKGKKQLTNGHCKSRVAAVAPYHTSHPLSPVIMTSTAMIPLTNGIEGQDTPHVNGSVHSPGKQSNRDQTIIQNQKNVINTLNHSDDSSTKDNDYVFRPIQTALKELAELGERQRFQHLTGKQQRNSSYVPNLKPDIMPKADDRHVRAKSEEKSHIVHLSIPPKKGSDPDMFTFEVPASSTSATRSLPKISEFRNRKGSSPAYVEPYDSLLTKGTESPLKTRESGSGHSKSDKKRRSISREDSLKRKTYQSTVHAYMSDKRLSGHDQDAYADVSTQANLSMEERDALDGRSRRSSNKSTPLQDRKFLEAELQRSLESLNSELSKLDLSKCDTSFDTPRGSRHFEASSKDSQPSSCRASGTFETISDSAVGTPRNSQISSQSFTSSKEGDTPVSGLPSTTKTPTLSRDARFIVEASVIKDSSSVQSSPQRSRPKVPNLPKSPRTPRTPGKSLKSPHSSMTSKSPKCPRSPRTPKSPTSPRSPRKIKGYTRDNQSSVPSSFTSSSVTATTSTPLSVSSNMKPPVVSPSFDEHFFAQQLQEILDLGTPVAKFPVSSPTKSQGSVKSNRTSYSESSTIEDLISDVSPDLTLKPIKPLTISNVQRMSQYDNISGLLELGNTKPAAASSSGTNYCKPWDSSNLWEDLMKLGSASHQLRTELHEPSPSRDTQRTDSDGDDSSVYVDSVADSSMLDPITKIEMMSELATSFEWKKIDCDSALDTLTAPGHDDCGCRAAVNLELRRMTYVSDDEGVEDDGDEDSIHPEQLLISSSRLISSRTKGAHQAGMIVKDYLFILTQDTSNTFGAAIHHFIECTKEGCEKDPHVVMRNVRQFMNGIKNYLVQHGERELNDVIERERSKLEGDEFLNIDAVIEGALHKCVIKPLKQHIYKLFVDQYKSNGKLPELSDGITYGRSKTPAELGVKQGLLVPQGNALEVIKNCLNRMQRSYSPLKKLQNFLAATSAIYNYVQGTWTRHKCNMQGSIQADDFLPLLMHVLVQSGMVSAEIEADYMWGLLHPSILAGEGGYYLTTLSSAVHMLKNLRTMDEASILNTVGGEESLGKKSTLSMMSDCQGFIKVILPDEQHGSISTKTFPIRPHTTTREICAIMAHKFRVTNPQDYGLYVVLNGMEEKLAENAFPQRVQAEVSTEGEHYAFAYKRNNAKFVWPICFKS